MSEGDKNLEKIIVKIYEILWDLAGNPSNYNQRLGEEMRKLMELIKERAK